MYEGVFHPNPKRSDHFARIKVIDGGKYKSEKILLQIKTRMEEAYNLRKILLESSFGDLKELLTDKCRTDLRSRRINDYIESILNSHRKIIEKLPTPEDFLRYYR